jgi:hypothetical protein
MPESAPLVTIAITRFAEPDKLIRESLCHAIAQQGVRGEVLYIEQNPASGFGESDLPEGDLAVRFIRRRLRGLSEARNVALDEARSVLVLFLDADAMAESCWARELAQALSMPGCAIVGSKVTPLWPGREPFFTRAGVLRDQYSLLDLGDGTQPYHRVVGAGFGLNMSRLPPRFRFDPALGRRQGLLFGGEESDVCRRASALGLEVLYVGSARVGHVIGPERCRWGWILKRMVFAGHGRARVGGAPAPSASPQFHDWLLMPVYLPFYVAGWLWGKLGSGPTSSSA